MICLGRRHLPLCCTLLFCLLGLSTFSGCVSAESIIATVGEDVTLTCNYDAKYYGRLSACWGRGALSYWDCADEVIKSDRTWVTSRLSKRYLLLGDLDKGDVSLTIRQVKESDSGLYSCRVEIPGWLNDHTRGPSHPTGFISSTNWFKQLQKLRGLGPLQLLTQSGDKAPQVSLQKQFKVFLGVGNIGRMVAIFFTIIIILIIIFRTVFLRKDSSQPAENSHDSVQKLE